ncbi:MAG: DUF899 family protein [Myxococcota bacterium]
MPVQIPGEDAAYRAARDALLEAERSLRREVERVAALRRALPPGGPIPTDYVFEERAPDGGTRPVPLSALFARPDKSLLLYSFMYAEDADPCPMCTSFLDALAGVAPHVRGVLNLAVVARGPIDPVTDWAAQRGWDALRMLSSARNTYHADYLSESSDGAQIPMINVFRRDGRTIRHFWSSELFFAENEEGQHPRHVDMAFPIWNLLDYTPEGRPADFFPQLAYEDD